MDIEIILTAAGSDKDVVCKAIEALQEITDYRGDPGEYGDGRKSTQFITDYNTFIGSCTEFGKPHPDAYDDTLDQILKILDHSTDPTEYCIKRVRNFIAHRLNTTVSIDPGSDEGSQTVNRQNPDPIHSSRDLREPSPIDKLTLVDVNGPVDVAIKAITEKVNHIIDILHSQVKPKPIAVGPICETCKDKVLKGRCNPGEIVSLHPQCLESVRKRLILEPL